MRILGLAPFLALFVLAHTVSVQAGLWAACGLSLLNGALVLARGGMPKLLEIGLMVLFAALAGFSAITRQAWTPVTMRLPMEIGLLAITLASLAAGRPFTLQYAKQRVPPHFWVSPVFMAINRRLTWAWAAAFTVQICADAAVAFVPGVPGWWSMLTAGMALGSALGFTRWYPPWARGRAGLPNY
jgi:hypothetical protein